MIGLFLDDDRTPNQVFWEEYPKGINWEVINCPHEFMDLISKLDDFSNIAISFDHDLQAFDSLGIETTGANCVRFLCDHIQLNDIKTIPTVFFHSKNEIGKENMRCYWNNFLKSRGIQL